jgi:MinD-like ATPase involved in chromosome partitioning or flagellar assembly
MGSNVVLFGWNRSIPGREKVSAQHFEEFVQYLSRLQQKGAIQTFDVVLLDTHGGDLNGFFLIKGESAKLDVLVSTTEWITHITRAALHLDGSGVVRGVTGDEIMGRMTLWTSLIPS